MISFAHAAPTHPHGKNASGTAPEPIGAGDRGSARERPTGERLVARVDVSERVVAGVHRASETCFGGRQAGHMSPSAAT